MGTDEFGFSKNQNTDRKGENSPVNQSSKFKPMSEMGYNQMMMDKSTQFVERVLKRSTKNQRIH